MTYIQDELKAVMADVGKQAKKRLAEPTSTWKHKATFRIDGPRVVGNDLVLMVYTEDPPYYFLNEGTKIRYAVMSYPFIPKTKPGSFMASPGQGKVVFRGRRLGAYGLNMPGIVAREWTPMAAYEYESILQAAIDKVLAKYKVGKGTGIGMPYSVYTR